MQLVQKLIFVRKKHDEEKGEKINNAKTQVELLSYPTNFPIQIIPTFAFIREWKTQKK